MQIIIVPPLQLHVNDLQRHNWIGTSALGAMDDKSHIIPCRCIFISLSLSLLQALDNVPVLLYILALKTLLLCLAFAGVKIYQSKKEEEAQKKKQQEKRRLAQQTQELLDKLKEDWELMLPHGEVRYAAFALFKKIIRIIYTHTHHISRVFFLFFFKETERKLTMSHRASLTAGNHLKQRHVFLVRDSVSQWSYCPWILYFVSSLFRHSIWHWMFFFKLMYFLGK